MNTPLIINPKIEEINKEFNNKINEQQLRKQHIFGN
jgi:hypothetical protein